jgi:hypothetical protein
MVKLDPVWTTEYRSVVPPSLAVHVPEKSAGVTVVTPPPPPPHAATSMPRLIAISIFKNLIWFPLLLKIM